MISEQPDRIFASVFYDPVIANAILDSILHHAHVIPINGKSYRLKDHLKKDDE
ncbi:ATP-binding protein [Clostridium sp. UBA2485]|uniref:ATP-binding protein n=1 Tax=Clostridium sp. UBA2485 TaxID=1946352 RepID=UPI0025C4E1D3|nr:ATP-binding protein [Clostridium sp. UBA2485]